MGNLRFKKDDFLFIRTTYPSLFIKFKNSYEENGIKAKRHKKDITN